MLVCQKQTETGSISHFELHGWKLFAIVQWLKLSVGLKNNLKNNQAVNYEYSLYTYIR